jgi:hypothetical protein
MCVRRTEGETAALVGGKIDKQRAVELPLEEHLPQAFHRDKRECRHGRLFAIHCDLDFEHGEPTRGGGQCRA